MYSDEQIFVESVDPKPSTECMDIFIVAFNEQTIFKTADTQWREDDPEVQGQIYGHGGCQTIG